MRSLYQNYPVLVNTVHSQFRALPQFAMSRLSQKELRAEIQRLGEDPPPKWTKAELQHRLDELYVEKDVTPPGRKPKTALRQQVIALNANSKNKRLLQTWCQVSLGMPITGNETIPQLQKAAMTRIYQETTPDGQDPVGFGKAAAMTYQEIAADHQYCHWVKQTAAEGGCSVQLSRLAKWLVAQESRGSNQVDAKMMAQNNEPAPMKPPQMSPEGVDCSASQASMSSTAMQLIFQLTEAVKDLKEEVTDLRQEQPRRPRKKESENSFSLVGEKDP
eukprot:s94_g17.t1